MSEPSISPPGKSGGNVLAKAFAVKIKGVPVILIGIPIVIVGAMVLRSKSPNGDVSGDNSEDTGQPIFLAKSTPGNWLAVDPATGIAYNSDGTAYYAAGEGPETVVSDPAPAPPVVTPPATPKQLSAHEKHKAHLAHVTHVARQQKGTVASGSKVSLVQPKPTTTAKPLPKSTTVKVKSGDTLSAIAKRNGTTVAKLAQLNNITNVNRIYAGSTLRIR